MKEISKLESKIFGPEEIDFKAFVSLQNVSFEEVLKASGTSHNVDEQFYRWKYGPPSGNAKIALVIENGTPVAANAMFPVEIGGDDQSIRGWQSCDTCTHPSARGKGYFLKCLSVLKSALNSDEIFFGFPNKNSLPGFVKIGWNAHGTIPVWVRPFKGAASLDRFHNILEIKNFMPRHNQFFRVSNRGVSIRRSDSFMNWRYFKHPLNTYFAFECQEGQETQGIVVLRKLSVRGHTLAVVMELLALEANIERQLLRFSAAWARSQGLRIVVAMNNTLSLASKFKSQFVPVPSFFLPKQSVLMGQAEGTRASEIWRAPWNIQIGDWDGF